MATPPVSKDPLARLVEQQNWLRPDLEIAAQQAIQRPFRDAGSTGETLLSILHGHWLHEPLHAIMTDIPIGSWTVAVAADAIASVSGSASLNTVADFALGLGLAGAAGAAITGMVDWSEIKSEAPRRIGAAHALLNIAATGLFAYSCFARRKNRALGRSLAIGGYLVASLSAHLGGNLVYEHGIGVRKPNE